jgi:tripartite-type tricarboxylate transporter receptor subunit TctC
MRIHRLLCLLAVALVPSLGSAADYPTRQIRIIVPYPPGGVTDILTRIAADGLRERLGQQVLVENRPGGDAIIGVEAAVKSEPDGYTLATMPGASLVTLPLFKKNLPFDPLRDLAPISLLMKTPQFIAVHSDVPVRSVQELVAYVKANPRKLNRGTVGTGSLLQVLITDKALGIEGLTVPVNYKGSAPYIQAVMSNEVQLNNLDTTNAIPAVKAGKIRVLAALTLTRQAAFPDAPPLAETIAPGFELTSVYGLFAPAKTPREIVQRLSAELAALTKSGPLHEYIANKVAAVPVGSTPDEFAQWLRTDFAREKEAAAFAKIQPE